MLRRDGLRALCRATHKIQPRGPGAGQDRHQRGGGRGVSEDGGNRPGHAEADSPVSAQAQILSPEAFLSASFKWLVARFMCEYTVLTIWPLACPRSSATAMWLTPFSSRRWQKPWRAS